MLKMSCSIVEVFELSSASKNPSPHVGAFAESVLEGGHSFLFSNFNEFFYRLGRIIVQFSEQSCRARGHLEGLHKQRLRNP